MRFRNYCVVVMGQTDGVIDEIRNVSETEPSVFWPRTDGILVATFSCFIEPSELTEHFKSFQRNFLVFELDPNTCGFNFTHTDIQEGLFGFLETLNKDALASKTNDLLNEIQMSSTTSTSVPEFNMTMTSTTVSSKVQHTISDEQIERMTPRERDDWANVILEKGAVNLTNKDKILLKKLSK